MKTRIISAAVMIAIVGAVLTFGYLWNTTVMTVFIAALAVGAVYELTHNAAGIKNKLSVTGACIYAASAIFALGDTVLKFGSPADSSRAYGTLIFINSNLFAWLTTLYFFFAVVMVLKNHKDFGLAQIAVLLAMPMPICYGFHTLNGIISRENGIYYLLLLFNFASICDTGAYFVGSACGKHKLCPEISPKKTVEGAIGGVLSSIVGTIILLVCFGKIAQLPIALLLTVPLCIIGMLGDLIASAVKRSVGLKDYSNLIPGHGGILDRFDSMLLIAPFLFALIEIGVFG